MANAGERHKKLMKQMAALTASLGDLTNFNPLLAQQTQTNAELSILSTNLGNVATRLGALVAGGVPTPGGASTTTPAGVVSVTVPGGVDHPSKPNPPDHSDLLRWLGAQKPRSGSGMAKKRAGRSTQEETRRGRASAMHAVAAARTFWLCGTEKCPFKFATDGVCGGS